MGRKFRILPVALALILTVLSGCQKEAAGGRITVLDAGGNTLAVLENQQQLRTADCPAYLEIALIETAQLLAQREQSDAQSTLDALFSRELTIHTAYVPAVCEALKAAAGDREETGMAVTDLKGNLLAAYSSDPQINYALQKNAPYSAFKPLSVYLPAIAGGKINWFTRYEDSPYKQIKNEDGTLEDWPKNSGGSYCLEQVTVYTALKKSLNTVAVKCLEQVGVTNSIQFLQESFGIPLKQEADAARELGEEEVIGNVALGYLEVGLSPVDMAGYYQIFGNGGKYAVPRAVTGLKDASGQVLYERAVEFKQVTDPEVADVMNRLLQGVVTGGTGVDARLKSCQVAGKTGTGDDHGGNWFVGLVPGYSCAVWHGKAEQNGAAAMFGAAMEPIFALGESKLGEFAAYSPLHRELCCAESGMPAREGCSVIELAYFITDYEGQPCNINHKK